MIQEIANHNKIKFLANLWIVVLTIFFGVKIVTASNSWQVVGNADFSPAWAEYISMDIDQNDTPYVLFRDSSNGNKATAMVFNGSKWVTFGNAGFSPDKINNTFIKFNSSNVPYVVFREQSTDKIIVMNFNGTSWQNLGTVGVSSSASWDTSLSFDSKNNPYVIFKDDLNKNRPTVKKFDGSKWVDVGTPGFSTNWVSNTSIAIDSKDTIYAGFADAATNWAFTVKKFDGSKWVDVGTPGFSTGQAEANILKIDPLTNLPYVAYRDVRNSNKITVKMFNGTGWVDVGNAGFASPMGCCAYDDIGFVVDKTSTPYIAYVDSFNKNKATVMKFDGSSWVNIGSAGFSNTIRDINLSIDSKGTLYVAFEDDVTIKSTVMKFDQNQNGKSWKVAGNNGSTSGNSEVVSIISDYNNTKYVAFGDNDENDKATVIQYDGVNSWSRVGRAGFTPDRADWISLANDSYGKLYVAYSDRSRTDIGGVGKASVMRYLGGAAGWVNIGNPGFSAAGAEYTRLALDKNDVPYVVFVDNADRLNNRLTAMKYSGGKWVLVGSAGFSTDTAWDPNIEFDKFNVPYVSYREQASGKATVMKFTGRKWVTVGGAGFTAGSVDYPEIKFDSNNNLYIAFQDGNQGGKTTVMKWNGFAWSTVGSAGFSKEQAYGTSLSIYNDVPYVSFAYVAAYSGQNEDGVIVVKYDSSTNTWEEVGTNPIASPTPYTDLVVDKLGVPFMASPGDPVVVMKYE